MTEVSIVLINLVIYLMGFIGGFTLAKALCAKGIK